MILAEAILAAHVAIILFNMFGLIAVPLGAICGWRFVRVRWWRLLHLVLLGTVALQALVGRACILTLWQAALADGARSPTPLIMAWINRIIYWPLPVWIFSTLYLVCFGYALALLWLVPPGTARIRGPCRASAIREDRAWHVLRADRARRCDGACRRPPPWHLS